MIAILIMITFAVGVGAGAVLAFTGGYIANARDKVRRELRSELRHTQKNLNIATSGLQKAMNPVHDGVLEADIALRDIEINNDNYLKGQ